jgi:hypothetical protein
MKRWIIIRNPCLCARIRMKRWITIWNPCFRTPSPTKSRGRL